MWIGHEVSTMVVVVVVDGGRICVHVHLLACHLFSDRCECFWGCMCNIVCSMEGGEVMHLALHCTEPACTYTRGDSASGVACTKY